MCCLKVWVKIVFTSSAAMAQYHIYDLHKKNFQAFDFADSKKKVNKTEFCKQKKQYISTDI